MTQVISSRTALIVCLVSAMAAALILSVTKRNPTAGELRKSTGAAQLASAQPKLAGEQCQWAAAAGRMSLLAPGAQHQTAPRQAAETIDRAPLRVIRDTYPTYSAVAVDTKHDEVFLQDENLFGIRVFGRLENTPPTAQFTEPKRVLAGINTKLEFNCALYIDPNTGDLYSVANDTMDTMVIFPRDAKGNVRPMRELHTPHRTYGIAVHEEPQELYLTIQYPPQVIVYNKMAQGDEKPIRILEGDKTQLEDPHGIALDLKNGWMFVSNHGSAKGQFQPPSITVYPMNARDDAAPIRIIEGPKTRLNWPAAMSIDSETGELYVANDADDSVLVFRTTDRGDAAPSRIIKGPRTGIKNPTGLFLDKKNKELWVSNMGNHRTTVYPLDANGDVAPLRTIRSAPADKLALSIGNPGAVGYDSKREEILVPN